MNLFFAYVLAVCPELHDVIMISFWTCFIVFCIACISFILADMNNDEDAKTTASRVIPFLGKVIIVLMLLSVLVPSQKRLNAMMLNYHATYDARNDYGAPQVDK